MEHFVEENQWFDYKELNFRLQSFEFHNEDARDRPPPIIENKLKLNGNAIQNWSLVSFLVYLWAIKCVMLMIRF